MSRVSKTDTTLPNGSQGQEKRKKKLTRAQQTRLKEKIKMQSREWRARLETINHEREMCGFQPTECRCTWYNGDAVCGRNTKEFSLVCGIHRRADCCGKTKDECKKNSITCTECEFEKKHCKTKMELVNSDEYLCGDCFTRDYSRCMFCHDMFYDPDKDEVAPDLAQCGECSCSQPQPCTPGCMRCYS